MPLPVQHPFFQLFKKLTKSQLKRFRLWLSSGLYTNRKDLSQHLNEVETLMAFYAKNAADKPLPEHIRENLEDPATRLKLSYLRQELECFLGMEELRQDKAEILRMAAKSLQRQQHFRLVEKTWKRSEKAQKSNAAPGHQTYLQHYLLSRDKSNFLPPAKELSLPIIENTDQALNELFILAKLQQACRFGTYGNLFNQQRSVPFLPAVLEYLGAHPAVLEQPVINFYYQAYLTLSGTDPEAPSRLTALFFKHPDYLQNPNIQDLYTALLNHGIRQMNKGNEPYIQSSLSLYKIGLNQDLLYRNGRLTGITFMNIVFTSFKVKDYDWARDFMEDFQGKLSEYDQKTYFQYCLANWHYEVGSLERASDMLVNFTAPGNAIMHLQAKITLAKIYFDQTLFELLLSLLNTITVYISRNSSIGYHGQVYLPFIRALRLVVNAPPDVSVAYQSKISEEIETIPVRSLREWIHQRIA